jgi:hypothetical protein
MLRSIDVEVRWDPEASVWVATAEGIGLVTEAETVEQLRAKLPRMAADLLEGEVPAGTEVAIRLQLELEERAIVTD